MSAKKPQQKQDAQEIKERIQLMPQLVPYEKRKQFLPFDKGGINSHECVVGEEGSHLIDLQQLKAAPRRIKEEVEFTDIRGFKAYVNDFRDANTSVFINNKNIVAKLDYHTKNQPSWSSHEARYAFTLNKMLEAWFKQEGVPIPQKEFAKFLQLNYLIVKNPSHSDLISYVRQLRIETNRKVESNVGNGSNEISVSQKETVLTVNGAKITVIEDIVLSSPVFAGHDSTNDFRIKCFCSMQRDEIYFQFYFLDKEEVMSALYEKIRQELVKEFSDCKIYIG